MNTIATTYSDAHLRILIEEYIAMQRSEFTFKSVCSYILYRAMEDEKTAGNKIYESNQLESKDCERVGNIIKKIVSEGRITAADDHYIDDTVFVKK